MQHIAVYCGSNLGRDPAYAQCAYELGRLMAERGIGLVYGGAKVGLMGQVAAGVLDHDGCAIGIVPRFLQRVEITHEQLTRLEIVDDMHQRKARMSELSDAMIALPGGIGTLEEYFEVLTWQKLGLHHKPIGLLNTAGFYDHLLAFIDRVTADEFLQPKDRQRVLAANDAATLLQQMDLG